MNGDEPLRHIKDTNDPAFLWAGPSSVTVKGLAPGVVGRGGVEEHLKIKLNSGQYIDSYFRYFY